jgi:hypothetical protein
MNSQTCLRVSPGPVGGMPPGTGFGDGELSGGIVGGVPGNGGSGTGTGFGSVGPGRSGELGSWFMSAPG